MLTSIRGHMGKFEILATILWVNINSPHVLYFKVGVMPKEGFDGSPPTNSSWYMTTTNISRHVLAWHGSCVFWRHQSIRSHEIFKIHNVLSESITRTLLTEINVLIWHASQENRPQGLYRRHTKRRIDGRGPANPSFGMTLTIKYNLLRLHIINL